MTDARPKHKPNEKHTLDEVLKSLKDLVHGEVLDQPAPAAAKAPGAAAEHAPASAPPMADMRDIISSLEDLLESDLNLEEKVELAKAALAPVREARGDKPRPAAVTAKPAPKPDVKPDAKPVGATPPAAAQPPPQPPAAPPPPVTPMFDTDNGLIFEDIAAPAETPAPLDFPEEMSDDDIAKALADIQFEMDAAPAPPTQPEPEPTFETEPEPEAIVAAPPPDESATEPEPIAVEAAAPPAEPAPPLKLAIEEPEEFAQKGLSLEPAAAPSPEAPDASGLSLVEDEIAAAPAPDAPPAQEIVAEAAPEPAAEPSLDTLDFAPKMSHEEAKPDHVEDLAPPPWEEDDISIDRAEPPTLSGDDASTGSLGESVDIDLSISDMGDAEIKLESVAELASAPEAPVTEPVLAPPAPPPKAELTLADTSVPFVTPPSAPVTEVIAPPATAPRPAKELKLVDESAPLAPPSAPVAAGTKEIPVLKNVAAKSATPPPPAAAATPKPAPKPKPAAPAAPESFALEMTPATPPKAPAQDLHQMAVRVIAKLNIELRKVGKPPLDAKTINRLQQLLKEALEKK